MTDKGLRRFGKRFVLGPLMHAVPLLSGGAACEPDFPEISTATVLKALEVNGLDAGAGYQVTVGQPGSSRQRAIHGVDPRRARAGIAGKIREKPGMSGSEQESAAMRAVQAPGGHGSFRAGEGPRVIRIPSFLRPAPFLAHFVSRGPGG